MLSNQTTRLDLTMHYSRDFIFDYSKVKTIGLDFDGTCVEHCFPQIGQAAPNVQEALEYFKATGRKIYLFSVRSSSYILQCKSWFANRGLLLDGYQVIPGQSSWTDSPKMHVDLFIDDRAFGAPLIMPPGFNSPVINWKAILDAFKQSDGIGSSSFSNLQH